MCCCIFTLIHSKTTSNLFHMTLLCVHAGSGDLAALGILEDGFKPDMEVRRLQCDNDC